MMKPSTAPSSPVRDSRPVSLGRALWCSHSRAIGAGALVILAVVAILPKLGGPVGRSMDGLFYEAQMHEVRGESRREALRRVFTSKAAAEVPGATTPELLRAGAVSGWAKYSARFYRRRWVVPAMAAAIYPIAGDRSLLYVSVLGYIAAGLLLFLLLRRRFSDTASVIAAGICLLLPPLRAFSGLELTDSWGLALEIGALLAALLALERGARWVAVWFVTMLVLSFTRDAAFVLLGAVGLVTIVARTPRSAVVLATGIAASIPAPVLFGAPLVEQLAYNLNGFRNPGAVDLSYLMSHYPPGLWSVLRDDVTYLRVFGGHPLVGYTAAVALVAAVAYMTVAAPRGDAFFALQRGAILGAAITVALAVNFTGLRLELMWVPAIAAAVAFTYERLFVGNSSDGHLRRRRGPAVTRIG